MKQIVNVLLGMGMALGWGQMAWAQTAAESELLSAQKTYQELLRNSQIQNNTLGTKQQQLTTAKQRLVEIQNSVTQLETEMAAAQSAETANKQALQAAGARLDAAWSAARR